MDWGSRLTWRGGCSVFFGVEFKLGLGEGLGRGYRVIGVCGVYWGAGFSKYRLLKCKAGGSFFISLRSSLCVGENCIIIVF